MEGEASAKTVVEASPLISFLKVDRFDILESVCSNLLCTEHVTGEILLFRQQERLNKLFQEERIREVSLSDPMHLLEYAQLVEQTPLGPGEVSSVLYAAYHDCMLVITDKKGIREAKRRAVTYLTTQEVMVLAIRKGTLSLTEADALIVQWQLLNEFPVTITAFQTLL